MQTPEILNDCQRTLTHNLGSARKELFKSQTDQSNNQVDQTEICNLKNQLMDLQIANHEVKAENQLLSAQLIQAEKAHLTKEAEMTKHNSLIEKQLRIKEQALHEVVIEKQLV